MSDPQWPERIKRLCWEYDAEVVYWTGMRKRKKSIAQAFPDTVYHTMARAIRGTNPASLEEKTKGSFKLLPLDAALIKAMEPYQMTAMKLMERMDADQNSFNFEERTRHYYRQLRYWHSILIHFKPDLVFFPIAPHDNYDYIVYGLCQHLKINTFMLDRTAIPSRVLYGRTIEECSEKLAAAYKAQLERYNGAEVHLPDYVDSYYRRMQGKYTDALPPNVRMKMNRMGLKSYASNRETLIQFIRYELAGLKQHIIKGKGFEGLADSYLKDKHKTPVHSQYNYWQELGSRIRGKRLKNKLRGYYEEYQKVPDLAVPYVFVALHYQPERNSVPLGGCFGDQLLVLDLLSKTLPPGWKIYVKEHGQQWSYFSKGERARSIFDYQEMRKLENVELVPVDMVSFDLIDNAVATVTIAGSVGWESIMRGKPALVFGSAWYQGCEGAYRVHDQESIRLALNNILQKPKIDRNKVRLFLKTLNENSIHTVIDTLREDYGEISHFEALDNFVQTMGRYLQQQFHVRPLMKLVKSDDENGIVKQNSDDKFYRKVGMFCDNETVLQDFVILAEKFYEDRRLYPILYVPNKLLRSSYLLNAKFPIEARMVREANSNDIMKRYAKTQAKRYWPILLPLTVIFSPVIILAFLLRKRLMKLFDSISSKERTRISDRFLLATKLLIQKDMAQNILETDNISAMIFSDDRVVAQGLSWLHAAKDMGIYTTIVSYALSHPDVGAFMRRERLEVHLNKGKDLAKKRAFAEKNPTHVYDDSRYGKLLFYPLRTSKVLQKANMLPLRPWISGGGAADKLFVISNLDKQTVHSLGITYKEVDVVGQAVMDCLWDAQQNREAVSQRVREKYKLDMKKPILVFGVPHFPEHKMMSWEEHERKLRPIFEMLSKTPHVTTLM